jgi:PAS domain S-box-containing protein
MKFLSSLTIRKKVLFLILTAVIPALGIILFSGIKHREDAIISAKRDTLHLVKSLAAQHEQLTASTRQMLQMLAQRPEVQRMDSQTSNRLFEDVHEQNPIYAIINAVTPDGNMFAASLPFAPGTVNLANRKHIRDAIRTQDFSAGEYIVGKVVAVPTILYSYPVLDKNKKLIAVVSAGIKLEKYREFMAQLNLPEGSVTSIADYRNITLYRLPERKEIPPGTPIPFQNVQGVPADSKEGFYEGIGRDNVSRIYAYKRLWLRDNDPPYLVIYVGIVKSTALHHANMELVFSFLVLGVACLFAMLLAWIAGNSIIVDPLNKLVIATKRFGEGEMHVRTDLGHRADELGRLANSFDAMADMLETKDLDRRKAEAVVREREEKYRSLFNNAEVGMFRTKIDGSEIIDVNEKFLEIFAYAREEVQGNPSSIHWADLREREEMVSRLKASGRVTDFECKMLNKQGEVRLCLTSLRLYPEQGTLEGSITDITERKHIEEALRESEQRLRTLMDAAPVAITLADMEGNRKYINRKHHELFGYALEEIPTLLEWRRLAYPDPVYREKVPNFFSAYKEGKEFAPFEATITCKDGSRRHVIGSAAAASNMALLILDDITERKQLESQLLQSQKMEAIGTLAGGVAHDFNNILTAIIGFASILQMDMEKDNPKMAYVSQVLASAQKAANLTQSLLAFSRKQQIDLKPHRINDIIEQTTKLLKRLLTEDIELKVALTPVNPSIMADVTQIDQILINLTSNAQDAMLKGGTLRIETGTVTLDDEFIKAQGYGEPGNYVVLSVSDTGVGMDEKTKEHVFEPFFTTKEVGKGTGLGLSTVYGVVKQHNGYITVDSRPNKGTMFRIWFPLVRSREEEAAPEPRDTKKGTETILVAEDDPGARMLIVDILRRYGYAPIEAVDGAEAVRLFIDNKEKINVVICDVVMPKMNGKEVYEEIKKVRPDIKVLFTSGYTRDVIIDKGVEDAAVDFITKPIKPGAFLNKVRDVLDRQAV